MKFSKSQFKSLMKECLSDLITEGAFDKHLEKIVESKVSSSKTNVLSLTEASDRKAFAQKLIKDMVVPKNNALAAAMLEVAEGLPEKMLLEQGHALPQQIKVEENQLDTLSGGDVSKWAHLAFNKKGN